jgi:peptidoglycan hydrolase-like protein with peptidoglycan-binding domain
MKYKIRKFLLALVMVGSMVMPSGMVMAQSTTSTAQLSSISALLQQIQALQSQIEALKTSQNALKTQTAQEISTFIQNLALGSQGDEVKALQALLASDTNIYPEGLITGYFGKATERAIRRFQKEHSLEQAGHVGPKTRALLNQLLGQNIIAFENDNEHNATSTNKKENGDERGEGKRPCAIVPPGHLIAPGWLRKNGNEKPIVPLCQTLPEGIARRLGLPPSSTTTPPVADTIAPVISSTNVLTGASTTTVNWITNEVSTSKLYYGTTSPLVLTALTTLMASNTTFVTNHSISLSGLATSTVYRFVIESKDASNNIATSSEMSFTTLSQ